MSPRETESHGGSGARGPIEPREDGAGGVGLEELGNPSHSRACSWSYAHPRSQEQGEGPSPSSVQQEPCLPRPSPPPQAPALCPASLPAPLFLVST